jgi:hypothetical protein
VAVVAKVPAVVHVLASVKLQAASTNTTLDLRENAYYYCFASQIWFDEAVAIPQKIHSCKRIVIAFQMIAKLDFARFEALQHPLFIKRV